MIEVKTKIFLLPKKKHDLLHSTIERSERESYCVMRAIDSAIEVWDTLSAYSIFHNHKDLIKVLLGLYYSTFNYFYAAESTKFDNLMLKHS